MIVEKVLHYGAAIVILHSWIGRDRSLKVFRFILVLFVGLLAAS